MLDLSKTEYLGLDRVLRRGSGEIIEETGDALLIKDRVSGACMLACEDKDTGLRILDRHIGPECPLLMASDYSTGMAAYEKYGFSEKLECYQVAYLGEIPAPDDDLTVRVAGKPDLPMLMENYDMLSPEELEAVVSRGSVLLGYHRDNLVGFIGEHLEGSMGLLYIFPEFRRRGYAFSLQRQMIAETMKKGFIPFGQVEKDNHASLKLQEKLGMTRSDKLSVWMMREEQT